METKVRIILAITLVSATVFGVTLYRAVFRAPTDEIQIPEGLLATKESQKNLSKYPINLAIPKLNILAPVREVGITSRGNMGTPDSYQNVGWYKYGALPGEVGSAVMAGHVDDGLSLPGVFAKLDELKIGDDAYVYIKDGTKLQYRVTRLDTYDFKAIVPEIFQSKEGKLLRLITCVGEWDKSQKTHDKRLVVTAELVNS